MLNNQIVFALVCFVLGGIAKVSVAGLWEKWAYNRRVNELYDDLQKQRKQQEDPPDEKPFIPPQRDAEAEIPPDYQAEDDFKYPEGEEPEDLEEKKKKEGTRGFFS